MIYVAILRQGLHFSAFYYSQCLQFEHRDLHWGNVLVSPCADSSVQFVLDGVPYNINSNGIKVTIIDFTLSRLRRG